MESAAAIKGAATCLATKKHSFLIATINSHPFSMTYVISILAFTRVALDLSFRVS